MTVLRNDPFGSGREGRFDVCAVKRTEVDESRGRHEDQVLRAGTENRGVRQVEFDLATKQPVGMAGTVSTYRRLHRFLLARRPFHCVPIGVERTPREAESSRRSALLGAFSW
jgi:hypothetical protein